MAFNFPPYLNTVNLVEDVKILNEMEASVGALEADQYCTNQPEVYIIKCGNFS